MERHIRKVSGEEMRLKEIAEGAHKHKPSMRSPSMSEGPMITDSKSVEAWGRKSFEHSVKVEIAALKKRLFAIKQKKLKKKLKKEYGTTFAAGKEPPEGPRD
ncbi:MAG: hypothetical protein NTV88_05785 [Candidatus Micrarchaeota archaeon]|nr:hypothetical protein [Candidatus Micrarchaeota archaeon]